MSKRWVQIPVRYPQEALPIPIVSDAVIATCGAADGKLIPLVIVDTSHRTDVEELIRVHGFLTPGDVLTRWGELKGRGGTISLVLTFVRPAEVTLVLEFDIQRQEGVVDRIVQSRGLYIQAGRPGDRLSGTLDHPRILVEVVGNEFERDWDRLLRKELRARYRSEGLGRVDSKLATERFIGQWRKLTNLRMKRQNPTEDRGAPDGKS
jgi:hypothetical protein